MSSNLTKQLNYICEHESIKPCIDFEGNNVYYTFTSPVDNGIHIIDHFLLNNGLFDHMLEYRNIGLLQGNILAVSYIGYDWPTNLY